ncbi:30S ribosomal protein S1 [Candidatus Berkelbacteria bacterium CG08_land_8_20_14_0_20_39_8]|uniref:30S ribosomal protein S1 n=1 Tax=Candidatus Berkelbacteria bacterium CG08_land_8_20_14_0_20_39_8 TaxID=1974511 RepID=A0A2M6YBW3_9BACT|nr:MAG: 30S ribosomal protein S1 [Candidatus Berkelbacteria bacterium CG08_land_8_20_14_0_20_39_8]
MPKVTKTVEKVKKVEKKDKKTKVPVMESMESLIAEAGDQLLPYKEGEIVEAKILSVSRNKIWTDVSGLSLGYVPEKEITLNSDVKVGDTIFAYVILLEDEDGNVVLSLKRADRERYWKDMEERYNTGEPVEITINEANKGGLISEIGGIPGFLPVSQLSSEHYPRVSGGDREEILSRLNKLIGEKIMVKVINCDKPSNKLIFSEKAVDAEKLASKIEKYKVGDVLEGKISGIVDFGLFVKIDPLVEGLVHISEVSWSRVSDLNQIFKVGDTIKVMVIAIEDGKLSLSLKKLADDPWTNAAKRYKVGQIVSGSVTKITPFGAFVSLDDEIDGLVHVSELSDQHVIDPSQVVELGKDYQFKIISIEPETHRLGLSLKAVRKGKSEEKDSKIEAVEEKPEKPEEKEAKKTKSKTKKAKK